MARSASLVKTLTIGSRGSQLALWQARHVASELERLGVTSRIEVIKTTGDHLQTVASPERSGVQAGGKGLFTKEIEEALLAGAIDVAVHSLKDLPAEIPAGLTIAAIPEREDPRDAIVGRRLNDLPQQRRVGTSSGRRAAQLLLLRPDLEIATIRGNVDTRLRKLKEGQYDAIVLAVAGLRRLGLEHDIAEIFSTDQMCPAPGQGALAIETRDSDPVRDICAELNHEPSRQAVGCERMASAALGGGCELPVGVFAQIIDGVLQVTALVISPDGKRFLRATAEGVPSRPEEAGQAVAAELLRRGASKILSESK